MKYVCMYVCMYVRMCHKVHVHLREKHLFKFQDLKLRILW